ncbi:formin-binding protein 4-like [Chenopodium quinoa]|uniref:formin-binding protein 4-like n=1 Tax=Chenopodium quinoa TaxID=63459 RepID=UPI000B76C282|nr:formin-binding protein 4-like [Chenopodium quinoa]
MTIVNDLRSLGKKISDEDLVRKILRSLTDTWTAKVTTVYEAKDLSTLSLEQLIGSLMTHEMLIDSKSDKEPARGMALKGTVEEKEDEINMIAKRFERSLRDQKMNFKGKNFKNKKKSNSSSPSGCFKCGEKGHIIRDCPKWKDKQSQSGDKRAFKNAMIASMWGESDSGSDEEEDTPSSDVCLTAFTNIKENSTEMVCHNLKNQVAELEVELDKCKVELGRARSSELDYPSDGEEDLISWFPRDLSTTSEVLDFSTVISKANSCNRTFLLKAFETLAFNLENSHKEIASLKAVQPPGSPTGTSIEVSSMINEYESTICKLHAEFNQLKSEKQSVVIDMSNEPMVLDLNLQLATLKSNFEFLKEKNELKSAKASAKKGKEKTQASESTQLKENTITETNPAPTLSSNSPLTTTKNPSPTPSPSSKSPSPPPPKNAPLPKTPEADDSIIKEPASSQGDQPKSAEEFFNTVGEREEEEVRSEEADLQIIGQKKGTSKPLVHSRVTRSSLKNIGEVVVEEQSMDSAGTKRKRTARKSTRGMSVESPSVGMTDLGYRVVLSGCKTEVGYFDESALSDVKELLEY